MYYHYSIYIFCHIHVVSTIFYTNICIIWNDMLLAVPRKAFASADWAQRDRLMVYVYIVYCPHQLMQTLFKRLLVHYYNTIEENIIFFYIIFYWSIWSFRPSPSNPLQKCVLDWIFYRELLALGYTLYPGGLNHLLRRINFSILGHGTRCHQSRMRISP